MKTLVYWLLPLAIMAGCAKKRPIERIVDTEDNRFLKETLLNHPHWQYKSTVIDTSFAGGGHFIGVATPLRIGYFDFTRDHLNFYNAQNPYEVTRGGLPAFVNSWKIEHSSYRLVEVDGKVTNVEEENDKIDWTDKPYFKIDYTSAAISELTASEECFKKVDTVFVEESEEFSEEHFGFVTEERYELIRACGSFAQISRRMNRNDFTYTVRIKHSFAPYVADDTYEPMAYQGVDDGERRKFGFFETVVDRYDESLGRFTNHLLANRWHPHPQKPHVIYLTEDFPEEFEWIYLDEKRGIGAITNKVFAEHGLGTRFEFRKDPEKKFGDVRYSFIKFVETADDNAPLGYGPSDAHPYTGQILRSDTIIWTSSLKEYVRRIRDYMDVDEVRYGTSQSTLFQKLKETLKASQIDYENREELLETASAMQDPETAEAFQYSLHNHLFATPLWTTFSSAKPDLSSDPAYQLNGVDYLKRTKTLMTRAQPLLHPDVEKTMDQMTEVLEGIRTQPPLKDRKNVHMPFTVHELTPMLEGVLELMRSSDSDLDIIHTILYRVAIHEFGHNLNLRHNFYGSVDRLNFSEPKETTRLDGTTYESHSHTSSVMDYLRVEDEVQLSHDWEPYDKAALVYAYSSKEIDYTQFEVELSEAGQKPTLTKRTEPKIYLYCSDEHRAWANPFCATFDKGTTKSEIILNHIEAFDRAYLVRNRRWGRAYWDLSSYEEAIARDLITPLVFVKNYMERGDFFQDFMDFNEKRPPDRKWSNETLVKIDENYLRDSQRALSILSAFYAATGQQDSKRPDTDVRTEFSAEVQRKGNFIDRIYSLVALGGSFSFDTDFNQGRKTPANFWSLLREEGELGRVLNKVLQQTAARNMGTAIRGYESFGRTLFAQTAVEYEENTNIRLIERLGMRCFTKEGLNYHFGIDADQFYPHDEATSIYEPKANPPLFPLGSAVVRLGGIDQADVGTAHYPIYSEIFDPAQTHIAAIIRGRDHYYLATEDENLYSFDFMKHLAQESDTPYGQVSLHSEQIIQGMKNLYDYARFNGQSQECLDYEGDVEQDRLNYERAQATPSEDAL